MKLYATTTSERATKGQGGNKRLDIQLTVGNIERLEAGVVSMREIEKNKFSIIYWRNGQGQNLAIIEEKAKRQKSENYKGSQREADDEAFDLANNS